MLFLTIRQAEVALADGRLDEAYQLVQSDRLRAHRRGQTLVTRLIHKLLERGRAHLSAGRAAQALIDCEKAQLLGGNLDEVVALRSQIEQTLLTADRARRVEARAGAVETAAQLVDSALGRQDLDRAVAELIRAHGNGCTDHRIRELDASVRNTLRSQIEDALNEGRLDQVGPLIERLARLDPNGLTTRQLRRTLEQAEDAWRAVLDGKIDDARDALSRIKVQWPQAKWIAEALSHLAAVEESLAAVRGGPLGLLDMDDEQPTRAAGPTPAPPRILHGPHARETGDQLPSKFIIQVDGAGSFLVLTTPRVTIGPISSSQRPDVGLLADASAAIVTIERVEDDYFERIAGQPTRLLASGDRVTLSPRCRLQFQLPNPSSTTAVLDLTAGRFPRADVRRIILLDRDLVIGPGASSHIRADGLSEPVVLHVRDGRLWRRSEPVSIGTATSMGGANFVITTS
ncbi:hypothetical protein [Fontivita pretiosa]|uniref:hypothetical protein n=1 Tax=Fontivita pretiosa TaxID=2989684 RepID=UPI003D177B97